MAKKVLFEGSGVALVTPFLENGEVDYKKYAELIEFHIQNGTDAIISCGTTGEASTLTDEEQLELIRLAVEVANKRVAVIGGAGSNYTEHGVELCIGTQKAGADGCLLVTPYYNKATQKGLVQHYNAMANAVDIPVIVYNVPSRTGLNITPKTAYELSKTENIVAIKEASGDITQMTEIVEYCGEDLAIYSGNDNHIVPVLSLGGKGVISVLANILPHETSEMVKKYLAGDGKGSLAIQLKVMGLVRALFCEVNPIPVKAAMNLMGMNVGGYRMPLTEMEEENMMLLKKELRAYGLIS